MKDGKWQLQDAKNKFSQVAEEAAVYGPQVVTRRGQDAVVILSIDEYRRLTRPRVSLVDFLRQSPLTDSNIKVTRDPASGREVKL
ncbi:MAG: prevent-host-death protein [Lentisphaerae bacterium RIFOXYB12_FULL_65_16]|nr:MAG: prevent-host-death protein [Lentisphaerae bacterium RIFOXYA12_64_32]OGV84422.1 MAG: prevent-host-death protein [Lentisphaerae bacterium RIFOXYB12_FULL_65_16]